jgi:pre-mRNA-processing factor 17
VFNPNPAHQNTFLVGCQDKKIYQFDKRSGEITQTYDQHSGAINSITFIDDNKRFVSTSDDKSMRCWEYNVPIVIKYVSEPDMHSMPAVTLSDNRIIFVM